jgi:hypothetical protein
MSAATARGDSFSTSDDEGRTDEGQDYSLLLPLPLPLPASRLTKDQPMNLSTFTLTSTCRFGPLDFGGVLL